MLFYTNLNRKPKTETSYLELAIFMNDYIGYIPTKDHRGTEIL